MENQNIMTAFGHEPQQIKMPKPIEAEPFRFPWAVALTSLVLSYFIGSMAGAFQYFN